MRYTVCSSWVGVGFDVTAQPTPGAIRASLRRTSSLPLSPLLDRKRSQHRKRLLPARRRSLRSRLSLLSRCLSKPTPSSVASSRSITSNTLRACVHWHFLDERISVELAKAFPVQPNGMPYPGGQFIQVPYSQAGGPRAFATTPSNGVS